MRRRASASITLAICLLLLPHAARGAPPEPGVTGFLGDLLGPDRLAHAELRTGGAGADERLPMIVAIHGLGDRPRSFARLFDRFEVKARIILPRGPALSGSGYSWFAVDVRDPRREHLARDVRQAANRVASLIRDLRRRHRTLGRPIVTGFSQGGVLTFALAAHHPDVVGYALPIAGLLPEPLWPKAAPGTADPRAEVFALHGEADRVGPVARARAVVAHLEGRGRKVRLKTYPNVGHFIPRAMRDEVQRALAAAAERARAERP